MFRKQVQRHLKNHKKETISTMHFAKQLSPEKLQWTVSTTQRQATVLERCASTNTKVFTFTYQGWYGKGTAGEDSKIGKKTQRSYISNRYSTGRSLLSNVPQFQPKNKCYTHEKKKKKTEEKEEARSHLLPFRYLELNSPSFTMALTEQK